LSFSRISNFFHRSQTNGRFREKYHAVEGQEYAAQWLARKQETLDWFLHSLLDSKYDAIQLDETLGSVAAAHFDGRDESMKEMDQEKNVGIDLLQNISASPFTMFLTGVAMEVKREALVEVSPPD
jgi:hypothetical protein